MLLDLSEIVIRHAMHVDLDVDQPGVEDPDLSFVEPLRGRLSFANGGDLINIHGQLDMTLSIPCSRCLTDVRVPLELHVDEHFPIEEVLHPNRQPEEGEDYDPTVSSVVYLDQGKPILDLDELLRQLIIAELPIRTLCDDACAGLCPTCGVNRNQGACACGEVVANKPLAGLAALLDDPNPGPDADYAVRADARGFSPVQHGGIKALTFDVFGTVVDWRGTITREGERLGAAKGIQLDWSAVAERWAQKYAEARKSGTWLPLDQVLRRAGEEILEEFQIRGLTQAERESWCDLWRRLDPWPDVLPGLERLGSRYLLAVLSNANVALSTALARHANLPWDRILGTDPVQAYKPSPQVYGMALRELGLEGRQVMMVAAHLFDLEGAKALGFQTAYVRRAGEDAGDPTAAPYVDLIAEDFGDLATQLSLEAPRRSHHLSSQ